MFNRMSSLLLPQGSLGPALVARSRHALACGAMRPIETTGEIVRDAGVDFLVRSVSSLEHKEEARELNLKAATPANPFLPHEPDLFVADLSDTHFALLNKFNVIAHHLLIVTRAFVHQETLLDAADFEALAACMAEVDGLAFYNGGIEAGASQPHKHLQLVPLPLVPGAGGGASVPPVPMETLFAAADRQQGILRIRGLPFRHAFAWLQAGMSGEAGAAAARMNRLYRDLLSSVGLEPAPQAGARQAGPYNLLATRRWMLMVPRAGEMFESVSVNSLGFAGSMFVRGEAQMRVLKRAGPMAVLGAVSLPNLTS
jgi:ATP adenylyltransferase